MGGRLLGRVHDDARLRAGHVGLQEELHAHRGRQRGRRRTHAHASQQVSRCSVPGLFGVSVRNQAEPGLAVNTADA